MNVKLIHFRLALGCLACIFFSVSGVICISVYFEFQSPDQSAKLFKGERTFFLLSGITHLVLFLAMLLSNFMTCKIISSYVSQDDGLFQEYWDLLALNREGAKYRLGRTYLDTGLESSAGSYDEESYLRPISGKKNLRNFNILTDFKELLECKLISNFNF